MNLNINSNEKRNFRNSNNSRNKITIMPGNNKLGKIPNISLPPDKTCLFNCNFCYARKFYQWPNVKLAWDKNYNFYISGEKYFDEIDLFLKKRKNKINLFRFHVGGDIIDNEYLIGMLELAKNNPEINFCTYTKKVDLIINCKVNIPSNFVLILSTHPDNYYPEIKNFRKSWIIGLNSNIYDEIISEKIRNKEAIVCPAFRKEIKCEKCKICYRNNIKKDIVFKLH